MTRTSVSAFFPTSLCGVLVFDSVSQVLPRLPASSRLPPPPLHTHLSHTIFVNHLCQPSSFTHHLSHTISHTQSLTHTFVNHHLSHHLSHTSLSTTIFHTQSFQTQSFTHTIFHTPSLSTIFVNHHLSHTIFHTPPFTSFTHNLSHTIFHTPSFTHHLSHHLSRTIFHTPSFTHNIFHSPSLSPIFVNLSHTHTSLSTTIAWQAWHLATCAFVSRGRRGTYGTGLALVARLVWDWSPVTPQHFAWHAWHLATSTFVSRGRRGTWRHVPSLHVAGVAYGTGLALVARLGWD